MRFSAGGEDGAQGKGASVIFFSCPFCGAPLKVRDDQAGMELPCTHCGRALCAPIVEDEPVAPSAFKRLEQIDIDPDKEAPPPPLLMAPSRFANLGERWEEFRQRFEVSAAGILGAILFAAVALVGVVFAGRAISERAAQRAAEAREAGLAARAGGPPELKLHADVWMRRVASDPEGAPAMYGGVVIAVTGEVMSTYFSEDTRALYLGPYVGENLVACVFRPPYSAEIAGIGERETVTVQGLGEVEGRTARLLYCRLIARAKAPEGGELIE